MSICTACGKIEHHKRGVPGHKALQHTGIKPLDRQPYGQRGVNLDLFICGNCGTKWEYENDSNDNFVGWSIA